MRKIIGSIAAVIVLAFIAAAPAKPASAACDPLPSDKGLASFSVSIEEAGEYAVWLRMLTPSADRSEVSVQIDDRCAATISGTQFSTSFEWSNSHASTPDKPVLFTLNPGTYTFKIAGRHAGAGVDKILLLKDSMCIPVALGDNCLKEETTTPTAKPTQPTIPKTTDKTNWLIIALCLVVIAGTFALIIWKYRRFIKKAASQAEATGSNVAHWTMRNKIVRFLRHHKLFAALCSCVIILACVAGVVAAASRFTLEAESATLYGGAKIVDDANASGGKYVAFEQNPPGTSVPQSALQQTGGAATAAPSTGGSTGGGGQSGGGTTPPPPSSGGGTPAGECPAYPAFPDDSCTGWQHTGVSLQICTEDDGDEGDGHLEKSNVTYDGCDFTDGAVVHGANVTIKRSRVQGVVSAHWSTDYDFQNLQLIDVEIIAATPSQIAAKTMIDDGGGSAISGANMSCLRCRIHYVPTGISLGNGSTIQDSYVSDVTWSPEAHQAAIGAGGGSGHNSKIIHNRLDCSRWNVNAPGFQQGCSSALSLYDEPTLDNVLVEKNIFNTGGGYCTYGGGPQGTNIRYLNNHFGKKYNPTCGLYGSVTAFYPGNSGNVWSGNVWDDGSGAVNP